MLTKKRTFTIAFDGYGKNKVLTFKYTIEKEDYETFYNIVNDFFTDESYLESLVGGVNSIYTAFPEITEKEVENASNLSELFGRDLCVSGIKCTDEHTYVIGWYT